MKEILSRLNADPATAIFIGDSEHDIICGRLAGVSTLAVLGGSSSEERLRKAQPDHIISSLKTLVESLQ